MRRNVSKAIDCGTASVFSGERIGKRGYPLVPVRERLLKNITIDANGCWLWAGARDKGGYGVIRIGSRAKASPIKCGNKRAHRISYAIFVGPLPEGMCVCHRCDVPACINPERLFLGTDAENHADRNAKGRQARGERHGMSRASIEKRKSAPEGNA